MEFRLVVDAFLSTPHHYGPPIHTYTNMLVTKWDTQRSSFPLPSLLFLYGRSNEQTHVSSHRGDSFFRAPYGHRHISQQGSARSVATPCNVCFDAQLIFTPTSELLVQQSLLRPFPCPICPRMPENVCACERVECE